MRARASVLLLALALVAPVARAALGRTPLERECETVTALALLASAVDEESGGASDALLVDVCRAFGGLPADDPVLDADVARRLLQAGAVLIDRMHDRHPAEQVAVARFCTAVATRIEHPDDDLGGLLVSWASRAVRVSCRAGVVGRAREALELAEWLDEARVLAPDDRDVEDDLRSAGDMLLSQAWLVDDVAPEVREVRERVLELLQRVGVSPEGSEVALEKVLGALDELAASETPDALALRGALGAAAAMRALDPAGTAGVAAQLASRLQPLDLRIVSVDALSHARQSYEGALDEWSFASRRLTSPESLDADVRVAVLGAEGLLTLPTPAALGFDVPRVMPGLTYVLTLRGSAGDVQVVVETERGGALGVVVPAELPDDAILVRRAVDRDAVRLLRARPWSRLAWVEFLQSELRTERRSGPVVRLFASLRYGAPTELQREACGEPSNRIAALDSLRTDPAAGETAVIDGERLQLMRDIKDGGQSYLELLRLPDSLDAAWLSTLLRALDPDLMRADASLLTREMLGRASLGVVSEPTPAGGYLTCDVLVVERK